MNSYWNEYIWLSGKWPYITRTGNPKDRSAQWYIEGLR
jgi:hypothetical protein